MSTRTNAIPLALAILIAGAGTACSPEGGQEVPRTDTEAKQGWDEPHPAELQASLRNRLATTQRDN